MFDEFQTEIRNNFSFWFPKVKDCGIPVPKTFYARLPSAKDEPELVNGLYEAFCLDEPTKNINTIRSWLKRDVFPHIKEMGLTGHLFVKNGTYSNKFDANGCCIINGISNLSEAIARINYSSMCVGAGGLGEIVVRQFIEYDPRTEPTIYNGLPFRSEFRVFYDFDTSRIIDIVNYWDYDYCYPHIHNLTDKIVFDHERERMERVFRNKKAEIVCMVDNAMKTVTGLTGKWSIDILFDGTGRCWLIDMAIAERSAYWDVVSKRSGFSTDCP